jgi:hypothetical protein
MASNQNALNNTGGGGGGGGDALVANPLSQFAATTSAQLRGVLSDETGTGAAVFAGSPTITGTMLADILALHGGSCGIKVYDRAGDATSMQLYSPTSGKFAIYRDLSAGDVFTIDGTEAAFSVPIKAEGITGVTSLTLTNGGGGYNTGFFHGVNVVAYIRNTRFEPLALALNTTSPAQITANQNDYSLEYQYVIYRLSTDASRNITGTVKNVSAGNGGDAITFINVGSFDIVLKHQDAGSTAANRFLNSTGADITLTPNQAADLYYDGTSARWRVFKKN